MSENRQLFLKAAAVAQYVGQVLDRGLEPVGIPAYLLAVLTHVRDLEPASPSEISAASGIPATTLRDNVQRLVDRGLVLRRPNPRDGRSYLVTTTARGRAVVRAADPALLEAYLEVERRLPRPRGDYERALDELAGALRELVDDPGAALTRPPLRSRAGA